MKMSRPLIACCLTVGSAALTAARAQGPLAPPGAPAPAMKTLAQVEPRLPVSAAPVTLSQPGSYYLTTNLSGTVTIATNNVSLDLMGFSIAAPSGNALAFSGALKSLRVSNGLLSAPAGMGINFSSSTSNANSVVENLQVSACLSHGIYVGGGFAVKGCHVYGAAGSGIYVAGNSSVRECTVEGCGTGLRVAGKGAVAEGNIIRQNADNYNLSDGNQLSLLLCELPETLNVPCSVRLAGTLSLAGSGDGITVQADDVTLDLAGHALVGPGTGSGHGVHQSSTSRGLRVLNGMVAGWCGAGKGGLDLSGASSLVTGVQALTNFDGFVTGSACALTGCSAEGNGHSGFRLGYANVADGCTANANGAHGFEVGAGSTASGCSASYNASNGFELVYGGRVQGSTAYHNYLNGFRGITDALFFDCVAKENKGDGFLLDSGGVVVRCSSASNGYESDGAGFHVTGTNNRLEENSAASNDRGFDVDGSGCLLIRNAATWNTVNWAVTSGNACVVAKVTNTVSVISGDSGGRSIGPADPFVNFTY